MERLILIGSSGIAIGMSFAIAVIYARQIRSSRKGRALPIHVTGVALSYCGLLVLLGLGNFEAYQDDLPTTWRTYAFIGTVWLGNVAIYLMLRHLRQVRLRLR